MGRGWGEQSFHWTCLELEERSSVHPSFRLSNGMQTSVMLCRGYLLCNSLLLATCGAKASSCWNNDDPIREGGLKGRLERKRHNFQFEENHRGSADGIPGSAVCRAVVVEWLASLLLDLFQTIHLSFTPSPLSQYSRQAPLCCTRTARTAPCSVIDPTSLDPTAYPVSWQIAHRSTSTSPFKRNAQMG